VRYGLYLPNFGAFGDVATLVDCACEAESAGWDGFFIWDHINRAWVTDVVDPWVALAAVASSTERMRLGALVTPLPRRRPWKVARETTTLDRLSGGRLIFGAGLGSQGGATAEWGTFGEELDLKTRAQMLDEGLAILDGLWSGRPFSHLPSKPSESRHYRVRDAQFSPRPLQRPRIPVWIAGYWPSAKRLPFRRAARWDGAFPLRRDGSLGADDIRELAAFTLGERQKAGIAHRPFDIVHLASPTPGDDPAAAAARVAPYIEAGATWWLERITPDEFGGGWQETWPLAAMRRRIQQGPPEELSQRE
jgi:alkanesulfonate monooxygenase SsuD/methylene tetrahydromethanopterin reductase-like flavin-dependent oxidoreductase (luciferase family)